MEIIDSHAHLKHGDAGRTEYAPSEVVRAMDGAGIARSVVFAMSTTTERSLEMALEAVRHFPGRLIPYVYALPRYDRPVIDELERALRDLGCKGIKLHMGECTVAEYVAGPVFELAAAYGAPCLIDFGGRLAACQAVVRNHPRTAILICHLGQYLSRDEGTLEGFIRVAEEHPNALLDASGVLLTHKIEEAAARVGPERILFGTDGPHCVQDGPTYAGAPDIVAYARQELARITALRLDDAAKEAILGGNIARLLRL